MFGRIRSKGKSGGADGRSTRPLRFVAILRGSLGAALLVAVAFAGCERDEASFQALLDARKATWLRELDTLKAQVAALQTRFDGTPAPALQNGAMSAPHARVRAILDATRQSLGDIAVQIGQVDGRVKPHLGEGEEAAEKAIERESARIQRFLRTMTEALAPLGGELDELRRTNQPS